MSNEFEEILQRARNGDEAAAREITEEYSPLVLIFVRHKIRKHRPLLQSRLDSTDFTQDVWADFFSRALREVDFKNQEHLLAFLHGMAEKKILEAQRRLLDTQKNDRRRECALPQKGSKGEPSDRQPTPAEAAADRDQVARLERRLAEMPDKYQSAVALARAGASHKRIAAVLDLNERTVARLFGNVRNAIAALHASRTSTVQTT
jgi:RNA polymerase sigma factor (sigma-70 family)